jgi:hypothetical protein
MAVLFKDGLVIDGLGGHLGRADVLVDGERIAALQHRVQLLMKGGEIVRGDVLGGPTG